MQRCILTNTPVILDIKAGDGCQKGAKAAVSMHALQPLARKDTLVGHVDADHVDGTAVTKHKVSGVWVAIHVGFSSGVDVATDVKRSTEHHEVAL